MHVINHLIFIEENHSFQRIVRKHTLSIFVFSGKKKKSVSWLFPTTSVKLKRVPEAYVIKHTIIPLVALNMYFESITKWQILSN